MPHRTSYVCGSFAIDRFGALASQTAARVRRNSRVAAGDASRAAVWPTFSSWVGLPSSAHVRRPEGSEKRRATTAHMMNSRIVVESLSSSDLLSATRELVRRSHGVEAALLVHLGEIDERKLYLDWSFSSMFAFCVGELGFSEDVACNRIDIARAARRMPVILEALRSGQVHLAGLRLLAPQPTTENQEKCWRRPPASRSARSKSWSRVFRRSRRFPLWCESFPAAPTPRPKRHPHSRSPPLCRWPNPSRPLLSRSHRHPPRRRDAMNAGP